jgi:hypothetical protein
MDNEQYNTYDLNSQNTPRGLSNDAAQIPSSYKVEKFIISNQQGRTMDIRGLVVGFTITEEIYSPIVVFNARIRDTINFFEEFALSGQEIIKLVLRKVEGPDNEEMQLPSSKWRVPKTIDLYLTVKEYPNYVKSNETLDAQEYNLIAISDYAYLSNLQRISHSVHGNTIDNISKIFNESLNVKPDKITLPKSRYACVTQFDGVVTVQTPLKAIEWLRQKSFDPKGAPFYVYTTISENKVVYKSWSAMIDNDNRYPNNDFTYKLKQYVESTPLTQDAYAENMARILSVNSNIKLDKLAQASRGGFANTTQITDFGTKTFVDRIFNIDKDEQVRKNRMARTLSNYKFTEWGQAFGFLSGLKEIKAPLELNRAVDANITEVAAQAGSNNASSVLEQQSSAAKSYLANIDSQSHEIVVFGDFGLNPGRKINIEIPKSANIKKFYEKQKGTPDETDDKDYSLSGSYIVAVAVHTFENGYYLTRAKIIRDNT